ncbi:putative transporter (YecA family protein with SEC-C motif) (fragment) [Bradyrhizobium sp. STM 3809]
MGQGKGSVFTSVDHANAVLDLVTRYHDDLVRTLAETPKQYQPRFPVDDASGEVTWEMWVEGFAAASHLRRDRFKAYLLIEGEVARAATIMMVAMDLARHGRIRSVEPIDLGDDAVGTIRQAVLTLHHYRHSGAPVPGAPVFTELANPFASLAKTGRNDPCPCGSGRKFKRCCGAD